METRYAATQQASLYQPHSSTGSLPRGPRTSGAFPFSRSRDAAKLNRRVISGNPLKTTQIDLAAAIKRSARAPPPLSIAADQFPVVQERGPQWIEVAAVARSSRLQCRPVLGKGIEGISIHRGSCVGRQSSSHVDIVR